MEQEPRPLISLWWPKIEEHAAEQWDEPEELQAVLAELKYRSRPGAVELRERVTDRLVELSEEAFLWPGTDVVPSTNPLGSDEEWPEVGMLKFLGYAVGQNGVGAKERRPILDYVYNSALPRVVSLEYMAKWGGQKTGARLQRLAESLAAFVRNAKRRRDFELARAIDEWEADLEYLRIKYYIGRYDFDWPQTA